MSIDEAIWVSPVMQDKKLAKAFTSDMAVVFINRLDADNRKMWRTLASTSYARTIRQECFEQTGAPK